MGSVEHHAAPYLRTMQRRAPIRWLPLLAGLLLLVCACAPALSRMTCAISGHSSLKVGQGEACCKAVQGVPGARVEATCCVMQRTLPLVSPFVPHDLAVVPPAEVVMVVHPDAAAVHAAIAAPAEPAGRAPPPSSIEHCAFLGLFRL